MARCDICHKSSHLISNTLGVCLTCIRAHPEQAVAVALKAHARVRARVGLPAQPPEAPEGLACNLCINECRIPPGGIGYCGLRRNESGHLTGATAEIGNLSWYYDSLPTNCVGAWVCAASTGAGYPEFARCRGTEWGYDNLAVFMQACTFDCLYCQNWQFKQATFSAPPVSVRSLAAAVKERTACICFFGGDPAPQLPFTLKASRLVRETQADRILRLCWETNGSMATELADRMSAAALETGGCIKFDLKAFDENLHLALTGITNRRTLENFERAATGCAQRAVPPPVIASTLLVPGYIDAAEVQAIAGFIAGIAPDIPYSLLGFHPQYEMRDLPTTSAKLAEDCRQAAVDAGLTRVHIGNLHLLS